LFYSYIIENKIKCLSQFGELNDLYLKKLFINSDSGFYLRKSSY